MSAARYDFAEFRWAGKEPTECHRCGTPIERGRLAVVLTARDTGRRYGFCEDKCAGRWLALHAGSERIAEAFER